MSNKAAVMGVLTRMNKHPSAMARSLRALQRSARVLSDNHPRLIDEYPNQWVAVADSAVMAHGDTLEQVLTRIDTEDISRDDVIIRFMERPRHTLIL